MNRNDALNILGLKDGFSVFELKRSYRQEALKTHPDRKNGNAAKFIRIRRAYDILKLADKKISVKTSSVWGTSYGEWNWSGEPSEKVVIEREDDCKKIFNHVKTKFKARITIELSGIYGFSIVNIHGIPVKINLGVSVHECIRKLNELLKDYVR